MQTWYYEVVSIDGDYANLRGCQSAASGRNIRGMQAEIRDVPI